MLSNIDKGLRSIVITSADRGEGKSTICANLSLVMAQAEKKVLLIDCDLRLPSQHELFDLPKDGGLTVLVSNFDENSVLPPGEETLPGLTVIGSGPPPPNPSEFLGSNRFKHFLKRVEQSFDAVIIDTPPVGLVTDAAILANLADGTVL
ncbi:MAG: tyrosine-protein kinase family protein, partial [Thermoleophilia bacterium]